MKSGISGGTIGVKFNVDNDGIFITISICKLSGKYTRAKLYIIDQRIWS